MKLVGFVCFGLLTLDIGLKQIFPFDFINFLSWNWSDMENTKEWIGSEQRLDIIPFWKDLNRPINLPFSSLAKVQCVQQISNMIVCMIQFTIIDGALVFGLWSSLSIWCYLVQYGFSFDSEKEGKIPYSE